MGSTQDPASESPPSTGLWIETLGIVLRRGLDLRERGDLVGAQECFERCLDLSRAVSCGRSEACARACLGSTALTQGRTEEARAHFEQALAIRSPMRDLIGQARSLNDLALCDLRAGHVDAALSRLRDSLSKTSAEPPGRTRAETLEHLGRVHRDRGDLKEALRMLKDALEVRRDLKDEPGIAADLNSIGMVYHRMGSPAEAFDHLHRSYELRRNLPDRRATAVTAHNLALVHYSQGQLQEAEALLGEALATFRAVGDQVQVANAHNNLGLVLDAQGRTDEALVHHRESLKIREELKDTPGQANSLNNLSLLAIETGRPLDALFLSERSIELRRASGLLGTLAKPLYNKGSALLDLGRLEEAAEIASEVVRIAQENSASESEVEGRILAAEVRLALGQSEEAAEEMTAALPLAEATGDPWLIAATLRVQAALCSALNRADEARDRLTRAHRILRGRPHPSELARIHREQGRLAAAAGAFQSATEQLQGAARMFASLGNRAEEARTLAVLAQVEFPHSPGQALKTWRKAEEAARLAESRDRPIDLGSPPGGGQTRPLEADHPLALVLDLVSSLTQIGSPAGLRDWLSRTRHALNADMIGLVTGPMDALKGDVGARPLPDGRLLWTAPGQADDSSLLLAPQPGSRPAEGRITESIPGTDESCYITAIGTDFSENARELLRVLALFLCQHRLPGIAPAGDATDQCLPEVWEGLVGSSQSMRRLYKTIERVARSDVSVLILGESGTGKELVARAIHARSNRQAGPFVPISCPSIPRELIEAELFGHEKGAYTGATTARQGKIEFADCGTLFLDEVADMDLATQSKLLRFLQEREFQRVGGRQTLHLNVRVLAATSGDLQQAIETGSFRTDLYFRLNVVQIAIPPLRERQEDIPGLVRAFLSEIGAATQRNLSITQRAVDVLQRHSWPGNVRELRNTVAHMAAIAESSTLDTTHIPASIPRSGRARDHRRAPLTAASSDGLGPLRPGETLRDRLVEVEARLIRMALESEGWNQSVAARRLGVTETMIRNRIKRYRIERLGSQQNPGTGEGA